MHITTTPTLPIFLLTHDGKRMGPFYSLAEAARIARSGKIGVRFFETHTSWYPLTGFSIWKWRIADYILIDDTNSVVDPKVFEEARQRERQRWIKAMSGQAHIYRSGPVPGTSKRNTINQWHRTKLRSPATTQERRRASGLEADDDIKVRPKRNARNLPTRWDEIQRHTERSWKRHRRTQWKVKA